MPMQTQSLSAVYVSVPNTCLFMTALFFLLMYSAAMITFIFVIPKLQFDL